MLTLDKAKEMVLDAQDQKQTNEIEVIHTENTSRGDTYALSEVAQYLKVSENRIRHWEKSYSQILSNHRNKYNHRVFTDDDVKALEKIKFLQDSGLYTKKGIIARIKSKIGDERGSTGLNEREYRQKLLMALNTLATEIKSLRREVREDLQGSLTNEIGNLAMLLFPPKKPRKWWEFWKE